MPFRDLVRVSTPPFLLLGFLARLPQSMTPLAILLLVSGSSRDYTLAGYAAAAKSVAQIAGALVVGRLADRLGVRRLGMTTALLNALATAVLLVATTAGAPVLIGTAALVGLTQPPMGALVRTHWMTVLRGRSGPLDAALSYETVVDEISFVVGPIAVGVLATVDTPIGPVLPLGCAAVLLVLAGVPFAWRYVDDPRRNERPTPRMSRVPIPALAVLTVSMSVVGVVFGAVQAGVTGYATARGSVGQAGPLYALLAVGNAAAGLACARMPQRIPLVRRYLVFAVGLAAGTALLVVAAEGLLPFPVAMLICGATIAPYMITVFRLAGQLCPERTATVLTAVGAGASAGTAAGQALAGPLLTVHGAVGAFLLAPAAAMLGLALAGWRAVRKL
jgi:MFS family permease